MIAPLTIASALLLACLSVAIFYTDTRYRRIPNKLVLVALVGGLAVNTFFGGPWGLLLSLGGFAFAFALTLLFHVLGTLGAGDVKLFGAVGSIVGVSLVLPTLLVVAVMGGALAVCKMIYTRHGQNHAAERRTVLFRAVVGDGCAAVRGGDGGSPPHDSLRRRDLRRQSRLTVRFSRLRRLLRFPGNGGVELCVTIEN